MKKGNIKALTIILLFAAYCLINWLGVGYTSSGAAVHDLREELQAIYGEEYTGRETDGGTEDMIFEIQPKTWLLTNWNLRQARGLDYEYQCRVIFTQYENGKQVSVRTICYQGIDPMGKDHTTDRAYINLGSKTETGSTT